MVSEVERTQYEVGKKKYQRKPSVIHQKATTIELNKQQFFTFVKFLIQSLENSIDSLEEQVNTVGEEQDHFLFVFIQAEVEGISGVYDQIKRISQEFISFPITLKLSYLQFYILVQKLILAVAAETSKEIQEQYKEILENLWGSLKDENVRFEINGMVTAYLKDTKQRQRMKSKKGRVVS